ncbi:DUF4352 domain-containing protein [Cellulomonas soli]|uniref:DUF4352 domain-containing protein n=1 Tax=Cellulomonas soli TaxID=931535 RepID=A0A512PEC8_9CELL|nr:DUF4352 domain-containing protein [Cellulomonas soli]NYI59015.1 hypothetical protein [Cellulomonas soli]GEP69492.1 hypothetical protein CSO01_22070 [Cellulomonas soli]
MSQPAPVDPTGIPIPARPVRRSWFARHKVLTTFGAVVVAIIAIGALGGGGGSEDVPTAAAPASSTDGQDPAEAAAPAEAEAPAEEPAPGIGTPVRDGKFEFTVTGIEPGVSRVGDDMLGKDAQGQFLLVHLTVTNIGDEAQYFDGSSQKLLDAQGRTHSADSAAAIYLGDADSFLNQINPGNTVDGTVVFDVPADATPTALELHDSAWSGGVTVTVG